MHYDLSWETVGVRVCRIPIKMTAEVEEIQPVESRCERAGIEMRDKPKFVLTAKLIDIT